MAYVLIALGVALAYLDYQGTANVKAAGSLAYDEMFGPQGFWKFGAALMIILAIGYIPEMEPIATAFLVLIFVVVILSHQSGFTQLVQGA